MKVLISGEKKKKKKKKKKKNNESQKKKKHRNHNESVRTRNDFILLFFKFFGRVLFLVIERVSYMIIWLIELIDLVF